MCLPQLLYKCAYLDDLIGIKTYCRLVEDQYGRIVDKSLCKPYSLTVAL